MSGTVERLARAMWDARDRPEYWDGSHAPKIGWDQLLPGNMNRSQCLRQVRAVLAALREPDEEMLAALLATNNGWAPDAWRAMIDAVLEDAK